MRVDLSVGDETPPDAMILMQWAPRRSSSRAARLTSASPSHTRPNPLRAAPHAHASSPLPLHPLTLLLEAQAIHMFACKTTVPAVTSYGGPCPHLCWPGVHAPWGQQKGSQKQRGHASHMGQLVLASANLRHMHMHCVCSPTQVPMGMHGFPGRICIMYAGWVRRSWCFLSCSL